MRSSLGFLCVLTLVLGGGAWGQLVLQNGADIDMNGSVGSQIIFPDGSTLSTAPSGGGGSIPAGHGGTNNSVGGTDSFIGGGTLNSTSAAHAVVGGGYYNDVVAEFGTIGGGGGPTAPDSNVVTDKWGVIGGGRSNQAGNDNIDKTDAPTATVAGGESNTASGSFAFVGGGSDNTASGNHSAIAGGGTNTASGGEAAIGGGGLNMATAGYATVAGGKQNQANGPECVVGGGLANHANTSLDTVAGGKQNLAQGGFATVAGGYQNSAGSESAIGGGFQNSASGFRSTVPGGDLNEARGNYSFAAGHRAKINLAHDGSFLFADGTNADFASAAANEFAVRCTGGARFVSNAGGTTGVTLTAGGTAWATLSSKSLKENYEEIDPEAVLETVAEMPVQRWNYIANDDSIKHIGPYAEDFYAAFGLNGDYNGRITTQDIEGVALCAIQGVNKKLESQLAERDAEIAQLKANEEALMHELRRLEAVIVENRDEL